jgi:hypothetical protein
MAAIGTPKFDGIAVLELSAGLSDPNRAKLQGKAAYVNTVTGQTHGWTSGGPGNWSKETMDLLDALRGSMEKDLANRDFDSVQTEMDFGEIGGLGEHVGDGVPQA